MIRIYKIILIKNVLRFICLYKEYYMKKNSDDKYKIYWIKERCAKEALKYSNRAAFSKGSNGAYNSALTNKWLDEICTHMEIRWCKKWTKETCSIEAKKYKTRTEFQKGSSGAWAAASKKGWLNEICAHMRILWFEKWTKETCSIEAQKYKTRTEFQKGSSGAWAAANDKGWLDEVCMHMELLGNAFKRCIYAFEFSDKYVYVGLTMNINRRETQHLNNQNSAVFQHMKDTDLIPQRKILCNFLEKSYARKMEGKFLEKYINEGWVSLNKAKTGSLGGGIRFWTEEKCAEESMKYTSRSDFSEYSSGAYTSALKNGWLDNICLHMIQTQKNSNFWTKETCAKEAMKYDSRTRFCKCCPGAYSAAASKKFLDEICIHMHHLPPHVYWSKERCKTEAMKYTCRSKFCKGSNGAYASASNNGWLDEVCQHMEQKMKIRNYWTKEACLKEAFKYHSRSEFKKGSGSAYTTAVREKWINDICQHMHKPLPKVRWTKEALQKEALKYSTRNEFKIKSKSAYVTALNRKWLDEICIHMGKKYLKNKLMAIYDKC